MPPITYARGPDPLEPALPDRSRVRGRRRAVLAYRDDSARTRPAVLHVGEPGGEHVRHVLRSDESLDSALRVEVVAALLVRVRERVPLGASPATPEVWLARPGPLTWEDADGHWLSAAGAAFAEAGMTLSFLVVTRAGWWDPRTDTRVVWRRLRDRSRG